MLHQRIHWLAAVLLFVAGSCPAATTITVKTNLDEFNSNQDSMNGPVNQGCSLREAIQVIDTGTNSTYKQCDNPTSPPYTIDLTNAGGTIAINSLVNDPSKPTGLPKIRNGGMPDIFNGGAVIIKSGDITCDPGNDENIFIEASGADLTLDSVTMHDCTAFGAGIAVANTAGSGNLTIKSSSFMHIKGTSTGPGGAVSHSGGTLTLDTVSFMGCSEDDGSGGGSGGAIGITSVSFPNFVTIDSSSFLQNSAGDSGGAIYVSGVDSLTISNDIMTANTAGGDSSNNATAGGGAIWAGATGKAGVGGDPLTSATNFFLIFNTQFISNSASNGTGGAIVLSGGDLSYGTFDFTKPKIPGGIIASNFTGNSANGPAPTGIDPRSGSGGAIYAAGNLSILQSSFVSAIIGANSSAHGSGGAIAFYDATNALNPMVLANVTISGNTADQNGGAIANLLSTSGSNNAGQIMLINDTIDNNSAKGTGGTPGGAFFNANGTANLVNASNTIFSNTTTGTGGNCAGQPFTDAGTNLQFPAQATTCGATIPTADPKLNGPSIFAGPNLFVFTMSLNPGSAASNAGTNSICGDPPVFTFDGTGTPGTRPSPGGSNCDIGAYESGMAPVYASNPVPSTTINMSTLINVPTSATVVISNTGSDNLDISAFSTTGGPQISVSGPAVPFTIPVGNSTQTLTLTCSNTSAGTFPGTLTVTHNATGSPATYPINCDVMNPAVPLSITTTSPLPNASVGTAYNQTFAATGGTPPYTNWAVTTPATFPSWATLNPATGDLTGTPPGTVGSPFTFTVQVTDSNMVTASKIFVLTVVAPPLVITTASPLPNAMAGSAYSQTFAASGGVPPYTTWTVTTPATFPSWATLNAATGALTGTPPSTAGSPFTFTIQVTDTEAVTTNKQFALTVAPPPLSITTASPLPNATVASAYSQTFAATGGTPPYTNWAVTTPATFPVWATLNAATGTLTGTPPNVAGSPFTFTIQVTDNAAVTSTKVFLLTVVPPPLSITTTSPLPNATVASAYTQTFAATGGTPPYTTWTVTTPATFPSWATLNAATGVLTGTPPNILGSPFTFTLQVTDNAAVTAIKQFTLTVMPSTPVTLQEFGVD